MVGMVARAMAPGCKVDHMPVFEGGQGIGKSTALKIIGGEWFSEVHDSILSKDWVLSIQGKLLTEVSELHSFRRSEMSAIKGRISDASDRFRPPYGRYAINCPRQGVMAGTTNEDDWNEDETGEARRFWPIRCHTIDLEWLRQNRLQLFAEALARYRRSELWHDVPAEEARRQQAARRSDDPWGTRIEVWLAQRGDTPVLIPDVLEHCLAMKPEHWSKINTRRIGGVLRDLGYVRRSVRDGSAVYKAFVKRYAGEVLSKIGDDEPF
jgi:putative DNA primase/helicase